MLRPTRLAAVALVCAIGLAAWAYAPTTRSSFSAPAAPAAGASEGNAAAGAGIFVRAGCWRCHGLAAIPGSGGGGPDLDELRPSYEQVLGVVTYGIPPVMPSFAARFSERQLENLAAFVAAATRGEPVELLPDLDPVRPSGIVATAVGEGKARRVLLGFVSATENVGPGPLALRAHRPSLEIEDMEVDQVVSVTDGSTRTYEGAGVVFYGHEPGHEHWHLTPYLDYELRREGTFKLVRRGQKIGFCLGDRYRAPGEQGRDLELPNAPDDPVYRGSCGRGEPELLEVESGISVGYGDPYAAFLLGQSIDVTRLAAGRYYLIHRLNQRRLLRETRYDNNVSSALLSITWPKGHSELPRVRLLAACTARERCPASVKR